MSAKNRQSVTYRELASVATNGVSRNSSCCVETFELLSIRYQQSLDLLKNEMKNVNEESDEKIQNIKKEINNKVRNLKIELDKMEDDLYAQLDRHKMELIDHFNSSFDDEKHQDILKSIKTDMENRHCTKEGLSDYQSRLNELRKLIEKLQGMKHCVSVKINDKNSMKIDIIGTVEFNFNNLKGGLQLGNYKIVDTNDNHSDLCVLPNGNFLFTNYFTSKDLSIYDKNFTFIKDIKNINNKELHALSVETNSKNRIYINSNSRIIMTDLDFNYLNEYGSNSNQISSPQGMLFHNESLYVCDRDDKCIVKLDGNLKLRAKNYLDAKPIQIQILNNLACIVPSNEDHFMYFYDLTDFTLKFKYDKCSQIAVQSDKFLCLKQQQITYYDKNGVMIDSVLIKPINGENIVGTPFLKVNNNKLFAHLFARKMMIF